jgi:putative endonuclease
MTSLWFLYILECRDGSYYTGVTQNVPERIKRHNAGKGAKYTRSKRPCELAYFEEHETESRARRRESEIKGWRRAKKQQLINGSPSSTPARLLRISGQ